MSTCPFNLMGYLCGILSGTDEPFYISVGEYFEFHELFCKFDNRFFMFRQQSTSPLICFHDDLLDFFVLKRQSPSCKADGTIIRAVSSEKGF